MILPVVPELDRDRRRSSLALLSQLSLGLVTYLPFDDAHGIESGDYSQHGQTPSFLI